MSVSVINSPIFYTLPKEIVNTILLFTGKFIVDKRDKTKLRSILILEEYENINKCFKIKRRRMCLMDVYTLNFASSSNENREREELQHAARADYYRHPLLFLKPAKLEEVMCPLKHNMVCVGCERSCTSTELSFYTLMKSQQSLFSRYIREYNCSRCNTIIKQQSKPTEQEYKLKKDYVYKYKHHRKIESIHMQIVKKRKMKPFTKRYHLL